MYTRHIKNVLGNHAKIGYGPRADFQYFRAPVIITSYLDYQKTCQNSVLTLCIVQ